MLHWLSYKEHFFGHQETGTTKDLNFLNFWLCGLRSELIKMCVKSPRNRWELPEIYVDSRSTAKLIFWSPLNRYLGH